MAGIGCAVVDVVRVLVRVAEQFDIVTDGIFGHRHKPAAYRRRRFVFLLGQLGELFQKKSARRGNGENVLTPSFSKVM